MLKNAHLVVFLRKVSSKLMKLSLDELLKNASSTYRLILIVEIV